MSTAWKTPDQFPLPDPTVSLADYMLAFDVRNNLIGFADNFLVKNPDPEFVNPESYLEDILTSAFSIANTPFSQHYAPAGWSPVKAAFAVWNAALAFMKLLPVNAGDLPNTNNVYDTWIAGTGYLYDGKLATPVLSGDGVNAGTGPSAGPGGILGGGTK